MTTHTYPSGQGLFFTSDTHFGHQNILQYSNRPFANLEEMDSTLIANWNSVVQPGDTVYHLGDFCFGETSRAKKVIDQLNGDVVLIRGNHDRTLLKRGEYLFKEVHDQLALQVGNQRVLLNHYPFLCYAGTYSAFGAVWQLFGHLHLKPGGKGADFPRVDVCFPYQYDVGVDLNNYTPISWEQLKERILYQIKNKTNVSHWLKEDQ